MERQSQIEIYVRDCSIAEVLAWAGSRLGRVGTPEAAGDATVYETSCGPLIVTPAIEGGPFVSLWFNTPRTPWETDLDCARDAARELGCPVRCDPGPHYPGVTNRPSTFVEVLGNSENLVTWANAPSVSSSPAELDLMFQEAGEVVTNIPAALSSALGAFPTQAVADASAVPIGEGTTRRVASRTFLTTFRDARLDAQLLVGPLDPQSPPHMKIQGCSAAIWRIRARSALRELAFECSWQQPPVDTDGGPNPGEGLDAVTWRTPVAAVSLGTEDGEFLRHRALRADFMPPVLAAQLHFSTVEYSPNGLRVSLRDVPADSIVQIHFVLAWSDSDTDASPSTWFAVDQRPEEILRQLIGRAG